jgi:AraC-like DNA-binding protein
MSATHAGDGDHPALPTAGLAGQVSFVCYWAREFMAAPGWAFPSPVSRPYATLWLIRAGGLRIDDGSGPQTCGPGSLVCWPPGHTRKADNCSAGPVGLYTVAFDLHVWGEVDFFHLYQVPAVHHVRDFDTLAEPCRALVAELTAHGEAVTLVAEGWARVLVGRWLAEIEAAGALLPAAGVDGRLSTVLAAIEADLAGEWSLERLAGMMCLSKVRVRELFVRGVGLPPMRYITVHRIAHARSLLQNTDLTCAEIARRCGFQDPAYFSRIFHRLTGTQPLTYREQARFRRE